MINFHASLGKAKRILEKNQYPPSFYDLVIIKQILHSIVGAELGSWSRDGTFQHQNQNNRKSL